VNVHLFDGTYELFRAWFGAPHTQTARGVEVGASRVFLRSLAGALVANRVTHAGVAFDHVIESFRNDLFDGYKTGEGIDPELLAQFEVAEQASRALGLMTWPMIDFEADDAIATAAARCEADASVERVVIAAVDKDLCQCVRGARVVCWDRWKDVTLDEAGVVGKHGVAPASIPDLLALVGDTADGIPGLRGWGKSSAAKVLSRWRTIEAIPEDCAAWEVSVRGADRLAASLNEQRAEARLYKTLATLRVDCPIACAPAELAWHGVDEVALRTLCEELEIERAVVRA
jgi:5'-3' exonuclease